MTSRRKWPPRTTRDNVTTQSGPALRTTRNDVTTQSGPHRRTTRDDVATQCGPRVPLGMTSRRKVAPPRVPLGITSRRRVAPYRRTTRDDVTTQCGPHVPLGMTSRRKSPPADSRIVRASLSVQRHFFGVSQMYACLSMQCRECHREVAPPLLFPLMLIRIQSYLSDCALGSDAPQLL